MLLDKKTEAAKGFSEVYWQTNYCDPVSMDCVGNAKEHASYIKSVFALEYVDISSVIDFGFGPGQLLKEVIKTFLPYEATGIEPSKYMFEIVRDRIKLKAKSSMKLRLKREDIVSWCKSSGDKKKVYDLGICTSVFQYLTDEEIDFIILILSKKIKYLYFTVPTNRELDRQISELDFLDKYALRRSKSFYYKKLKRHFTFVSSRILESKVHFDELSTHFTDLLFRF